MAEPLIIIVEDEPDIADLIRFHVEREGYRGKIFRSGRIALEEIRRLMPNLIVLDLMLPDLDGLEICRRLKWEAATRSIPILIVSAKGEETDVVTGLELGADDYVTKPFSPRVLVARIKSLFRRLRAEAEAGDDVSKRITLFEGALVIDLDRHRVVAAGEEIALTSTEFGILCCLARRPGFVRTRDQIISAVHGDSTILSNRTVDVHVTAIRRKLGDLGVMLQTVRGVGYRLAEPPAEVMSSAEMR